MLFCKTVIGSTEDEIGLINFSRLNPFWSHLETTSTNPDNSTCGQNNKLARKNTFHSNFQQKGKSFVIMTKLSPLSRIYLPENPCFRPFSATTAGIALNPKGEFSIQLFGFFHRQQRFNSSQVNSLIGKARDLFAQLKIVVVINASTVSTNT
jgi:hypothetical protein